MGSIQKGKNDLRCTKQNLELGEDGTFRLLEKVKCTFAGRTKRKFSQTEDYNFMPEERFEEILDMNEAQVYFFPQLCLDYDKYPRLCEMRCRDGKIVKLPSLVNLTIHIKQRNMTAHRMLTDMQREGKLEVFGPDVFQQEVLNIEN